MAQTCADFMIDRLHAWGVRRIYGYPGDGINGLMGSLREKKDKMTFTQTRHEELAAFAACAHAKFTGQVGVCMATSGPGAIHLLNGLYDAHKDNMPVVAIIGQQKRLSLGGDYQQEVDLTNLYKDVARNYVHQVNHPAQTRTLIDQAMRIAKAERCVTAVVIPADIQDESYIEPPRKHGVVYSGVGYREPVIVPEDDDLKAAAKLLNEGEKVAMLVGAGCLRASSEVMQVAELLGAGVSKALLGKAVIDDSLPYCCGSIGLLGTEPSDYIMQECDTLLMVGTSFPYSEWLPKQGQAKAVQIDIKPRKLALRYPVDIPLHGDARPTLKKLIPLLEKKDNTDWRQSIEEKIKAWWQLLEERAHNEADPINPQLVFWELSKRLPDDVVITADSGSSANWWARDLKVRPSMLATLSGGLATMCPGVPYAMAGKFAHPDRPVIACVGDGAMQMLGNNGLITIAEHYEEWPNKTLIILVLNNRDLNQVTWEQRVMAGDPKFDVSQELPAFNYAEYGKSLGLEGLEVKEPDQLGSAIDHALAAQRPVVLDVHTDPDVAPLPPHIKFEQAVGFMQSVLGDSSTPHQVKEAMKGTIEAWLPRGGKE